MATPVLPDWMIGMKITAALLDALNTAVAYAIDNQPRVAVYVNSAAVSCANDTLTRLDYDAEVTGSDTDAMWTDATPSRVKINTSGWYHFEFFCAFDSGPTFTDLVLNPRLNSGGTSGGGTSLRSYTFGSGRRVARFGMDRKYSAGDYVELFVSQTSGGTRSTSTGNNVTGITCFRFGG